jgi:hypothetical protein
MPDRKDVFDEDLEPAQAAELALLVDVEARWENLRKSSPSLERRLATQNLQRKQKAYETFFARLAAYNKRYVPAHVPEMLLNTPTRLGKWCRGMRRLYTHIEHDPHVPCPVHLLEKAYRWADCVAARKSKDHVGRSTPPGTIREAIRDLEMLARWCDDLG